MLAILNDNGRIKSGNCSDDAEIVAMVLRMMIVMVMVTMIVMVFGI